MSLRSSSHLCLYVVFLKFSFSSCFPPVYLYRFSVILLSLYFFFADFYPAYFSRSKAYPLFLSHAVEPVSSCL